MSREPAYETLVLFQDETDCLREDVLTGLASPQKMIPSKYLYDQKGCQLFDQICELDQYYLTRTEQQIMNQSVSEMVRYLGPDCMLIEFGSGTSEKTRCLLNEARELAAYAPVDIATDHLNHVFEALSRTYRGLEILPVKHDFSEPFDVPESSRTICRRVVYFPGSTVGNFAQDQAIEILQHIRQLCDVDGGLLVGFDLQKDVDVITAAYNDRDNVTAQFNLNLLTRINRELQGTIDCSQFYHDAPYCSESHRIEMHLVSRTDQVFQVDGTEFSISAGESICTEYSTKYTVDGFTEMAAEADLTLKQVWTDERHYFAVAFFEAD